MRTRTLGQIHAEYVALLRARLDEALGLDAELPKRRGRKPGRPAKRRVGRPPASERVVATRKPRRKADPARQAAMVRQGKYMAATRRLSQTARKRVKAVRAEQGFRAAIALAKALAEKPAKTIRSRVKIVARTKPVAEAVEA